MSSDPTHSFRAARDFLFAHRDDSAAAYPGFQWPKLDRFNWALDWFDQIAVGDRRNQMALWVAYEDGRQDKLTFAELSERSNRIANYFRGLGVKRGDRVLLMLGNIPPLWETMLAMIKLGAVIIPATTLLTANDLADRIARGHVRHIVCSAELAPKIEAACGSCTRIAIGGKVPGWQEYEQGYSSPTALFHLRHHGQAQAGNAFAYQLSRGPSFHHVLDRHQARRHSLQSFFSGLGQTCLELLLCALEC